MTEERDTRLKRDIGFTGSAFLAFNGVIGAGIFALPATLYAQFGTFSPWLFPMFGLLVLAVAFPFSRLAAYHPGTGGPVAYASVFGPFASFQTGWIYYVARAAAFAANANVFASYLASIWPPLSDGFPRAALLVALCGSLTLINILGVKRAVRALDALTLLKAMPLVAAALWGLAWVFPDLPAPGPLPALSGIEVAALLILYAFVGFENSVVPAGETVRPERTIPRALMATIIGTAILYFVVQLAYVSVMPADVASSDAPLVEFGRTLAGPVGGYILIATALCSLGGNLTSILISTPRVTFALADRGTLPRWFGAVHPRFATPANSILFMGVLATLLAVSGSFVWLAVVSTLARMIVYAVSIAALPKSKKAAGAGSTGLASFVTMAVGLAICAWAASQSDWKAWGTLGALVLAGMLLYALAARARVRRQN